MRIKRAIIIPVIAALAAAGSILAGSAVAGATTQASSAHVVSAVSSAKPDTYYNG